MLISVLADGTNLLDLFVDQRELTKLKRAFRHDAVLKSLVTGNQYKGKNK